MRYADSFANMSLILSKQSDLVLLMHLPISYKYGNISQICSFEYIDINLVNYVMSVKNYSIQRTVFDPVSEHRKPVLPESSRFTYPQFNASQLPHLQPTKFTLPPIRELLRDNVNETAVVSSPTHLLQPPQPSPPQQFVFNGQISPNMSRSSSYQSLYSHQPAHILKPTQEGHISPTVVSSQSLLNDPHRPYQLQTPSHEVPNLPSPSSNAPSPVMIDESKEKLTRRKRQNLPRQTTLILLNWLSEHLDRPYPNSREKYELLMKTRLSIQQLDNWFINARRRKINILKKLKENDQSIALSF